MSPEGRNGNLKKPFNTMIIKIPVYLEIPDIDQGLLPEVVETLANSLYKIVRKEDFNEKSSLFVSLPPKIRSNFSAKILSKKQALEHLRVK